MAEGIEPYIDPKRYDVHPARKVLVEFRTDIWRTEKSDEPASPLMSPRGTKWADLAKEMEIEVSLRDEEYEAKERKERKKDDDRELAAYAEVLRMFERKARRRKRRDDITLTCGDWGLLKGTFGLRKKDVDRAGDVKEEEGSLGGWLDIALQSNKTQRQISPERRTLGDGEDLGHDEKSVSVSCSFPYSFRRRSDSGANATNQDLKLCRIRVALGPLQHPSVDIERNTVTIRHPFEFGKGMGLIVSNVLLRRGI